MVMDEQNKTSLNIPKMLGASNPQHQSSTHLLLAGTHSERDDQNYSIKRKKLQLQTHTQCKSTGNK